MPFSGKDPPVYHIHGIGNAASDDAAFAQLVSAVNTRGKRAMIAITGDLHLTGVHEFTASPHFTCIDEAMISFSGITARIIVGDPATHFGDGAAVSIDATASKQSYISLNAPLPLANGDMVLVWADNEVDAPYTPHDSSPLIQTRPAEVLEIQKPLRPGGVYSSTDFFIGGYIWDALITAPKIYKFISPIIEPVLDKVNWRQVGASATQYPWSFYGCRNLKIEGCRQMAPSPGQVLIAYCLGASVIGNYWGQKLNPDEAAQDGNNIGYNIVVAASRGVIFQHNHVNFARHGFTTGAIASAGHRYGNVRDTKVVDNFFDWSTIIRGPDAVLPALPGDPTNTSCVGLHSEGTEVEIARNEFQLPSTAASTAVAVSTVARYTRILDNRVFSGNNFNTAFIIHGPNTEIAQNRVSGGWRGIRIFDPPSGGGQTDGTFVHDNVFENMVGDALVIDLGNNQRFHRNTVINCGSTDNSIVEVAAGTGHSIDYNVMPKGSNDFTVTTNALAASAIASMAGNEITGFANGMGLDTSLAATPQLQLAWHQQTRTEQVSIVVRADPQSLGHSFVMPGDKYKAIGTDYLEWDPVADPLIPLLGILIDAWDDYLRIVPVSEVINIAVADLPGGVLGSSYNLPADGPYLYYDIATSNYTEVAAGHGDPILFVNDHLGSPATLQGIILGSAPAAEAPPAADCTMDVVLEIDSFAASATHLNNYTRCNKATGMAVTINTGVFATGDTATFEQRGVGIVTFVPGVGVTIRSRGSLMNTSGQYAVVSIIADGSNEFTLWGDRA